MKKLILSGLLSLIIFSGLKAQLAFNVTNATCFAECNGSAIATCPGASLYVWSSNDSTQTATNLCAGTYWCSAYNSSMVLLDSVSVYISQPAQLQLTLTATSATCSGGNGYITTTLYGGTPPYTFQWSNFITTQDAYGLAPGTYYLIATDANGCSVTDSATVLAGAIDSMHAQVNTITPPTCSCNGSATITIQGAVYPVMYLWSDGDTSSHPQLCYGNYSLTVSDANGCTAGLNVSVPDSAFSATTTNTGINCTNPVDTTILNVAHSSQFISVYWGDGDSSVHVAWPVLHTYASGGVYTLAVADSAGCVADVVDDVINYGVVPVITVLSNPVCNNLNSGSLVVTGTGGAPPYTYKWFNGVTSDTVSNLATGDYTVTVTDSTGCAASLVYHLAQLAYEAGYYVYMQAQSANCGPNGLAIASVAGGTPPFSYAWNTNPVQTTDTISSLPGDSTYSVTVTDAIGCIVTGSNLVPAGCDNIITGQIYLDVNGDCVYDTGDLPIYNYIYAQGPGGTFYGYVTNAGQYRIEVPDTGTYYLVVWQNNNTCQNANPCGNNPQSATFTSMGTTASGYNFGYQQGTGNFDLTLHPGWSPASPGFQKTFWFFYYNQTGVPYVGTATVVLHYDHNLVYQYSDNPQPVYNGTANTLTWTFDTVPGNWSNRVNTYFLVPDTLSPNYLLQTQYSITPTQGDCDSVNNFFNFSETCGGSHDPNEKIVSPAGAVTESDSVLTYTIWFQNTGTDSTHFVILKDTLSANLDPSTVLNIASSAKYSSFTISGKGILTWTFNPYFLPDSLTDPMGSKGFVMFTVKKKANLPVNATISNTASVYFDYNPPVVTNTVTDTVANPTLIFEVEGNGGIEVKAFPNPFNDVTNIVVTGISQKFGFELYDVTGRLQQSIPTVNNNQFQIHRDGLAGGVYLYRILVNDKQVAYGKLVVE